MNQIDRIDRHILRELAKDARQPNTRLAGKVGLSPSACLRRVQELERQGIISGYRAVVDRKKLGSGFLAYVAVGLADHGKPSLIAFERAMSLAPEVLECHEVTGSYEYLLRVQVADLDAYKHFHSEVLGVLPHVTSIVTHVVMSSTKDERG